MDTLSASAYAGAMSTPHERSDDTRRSALAELENLRHDGDALGGSFVRLLRRAGSHFGGCDADDAGDRIELWGRRIGRSLSAVALVALCIYLYAAYLR